MTPSERNQSNQPPMNNELKPCPFCGGQPEQEDILNRHVECPSCGLQGPWAHGVESAAGAWNRRPTTASPPPVDAIREVVRISDREHPAWAEVKTWLAGFQMPRAEPVTPSERKAAAMARTKAREEEERQERAAALKRHQAKSRAITKRDSTMPKGKR